MRVAAGLLIDARHALSVALFIFAYFMREVVVAPYRLRFTRTRIQTTYDAHASPAAAL